MGTEYVQCPSCGWVHFLEDPKKGAYDFCFGCGLAANRMLSMHPSYKAPPRGVTVQPLNKHLYAKEPQCNTESN